MKKLLIFAVLVFSMFLFVSSPVLAQEEPAPLGSINLGQAQGDNGVSVSTSVNELITNSIRLVFIIAAILVLVMLIWGGIEWVMSGGDKEKVGNARKRIVASLVGMAIIALAFVIVTVVGQILNFNVLDDMRIPTLSGEQP